MHWSSRTVRIRGMGRFVIVSLAIAIAGGCTPQDTPTGVVDASASPAPGVVMPRGATVDVGTTGPGVDDGVPFFAFSSTLAPAETRAAYAEDLERAGYERRGDADGWAIYTRGRERLAVRIAEAGPPTSIIVKVLPALVAGEPDPIGQSTPGANPLGTPDPPHGPALTDPTPGNGAGNGNDPGQGPGTGQGGGSADGNGNGQGTPGSGSGAGQGPGSANGGNGGNGNGGNGNGGGGRPAATPTPSATPAPTPTAKPKPTQKPRPTPKPTHTPRPSQGGNGG